VNLLTRLEHWKSSGTITGAQYDVIAALARGDRFSVFVELNALFYLGVLAIVAGIGWTMTTYSARLGDAAIVACLTGIFFWSLSFCFLRALPYSPAQSEPPSLAFDYVLYLGCLVFALDLGYIQSRFDPFQLDWDHSLLVASAVFFALAYRFDNRLVLSLALSSLAGWCGVRLSRFDIVVGDTLRLSALAYGMCVAVIGHALYRAAVKPHFLETYLHVAANVLFVAALSGVVVNGGMWPVYLLTLLGLAGFAVVAGIRFDRFAFVVYGVVYGYLGISFRIVSHFDSLTPALAYIVVSATIMVFALVRLARGRGRES